MLSPSFYVRNPSIAFAWLWIGGTPITVDDLTGRPRHLEAFSCHFDLEELGNFDFQLFDPDYDFIEEQVAKSKGECTFKFGYTHGNESPLYTGKILEYVPEFLYDGIRIHLRGTLEALTFAKAQKTRAWPDKKISDIVREIAADNGFKADVDDTKKVEFREELEETDLKNKKWNQHGSDWQFLLTKLQKQAVREKDDAGGYVMYVDADTKTLHFHPPRYEKGPVRTFVWRDKMTEVIRFSPSYQGNMLATLFTGGMTAMPSQDAENSETKPNPQSVDKGSGKGSSTDPARNMTRKPETQEEFAAQARGISDWNDKYMAQNAAKFWWYRAAWMAAFEGELEIVGDPSVKPWEKYEVQVHKKTGGLHWTSGLYWCHGIDHKIEGGTYTTTLGLWRSDGETGEIANPKLAGG